MQLFTSEELNVNYYKWALKDAERELNENFSLLKKVKGTGAISYITYLNSLSESDKRMLAFALVKISHQKAVNAVGDSCTEQETELVENFRKFYMNFFADSLSEINFHNNGMRRQNVSKKKVSKLLIDFLTPICGAVEKSRSKSEWLHRARYENYAILTSVSVYGAISQIRYSHIITHNITNSAYEIHLIDLMRWLGAGGTEWNLLTAGDEESATQSVAHLCSHFMKALPLILNK